MFDYYLFDLDGVLVDVTDSYRYEVFEEVSERLGRDFTDEQIRNLWHGIGGESREEILRSWGEEPRDFWDVFDSVDTPERRIEHTYAYGDVDALERIDAPMGVVTHSPPELAEKALEKTGVEDEFDSVVSCTYETGFKPDPTPIETCMEDIGGEPDSTIMVGDSVSDVKGARNAGIVAGHIDRVGHEVEADYRFESLDDVAEIHADSTDETPEFSPTRSKQAR